MDVLFFDGMTKPVSGTAGFVKTGVGQCNQKFFTAYAGQKITCAQVGLQPACHLDQNGIARGMPQTVIHRFESVKINHHHCKNTV